MAKVKKYDFINNENVATRRLEIILILFIIVLIPCIIWVIGMRSNKTINFFQGSSYSFYYPSGWQINKIDMSNIDGTEFYLQPINSAPPETPHIIVEVAPVTRSSVQKIMDPFRIFKYQKIDTTIDGVTAQMFTNIVPSSEGVLHSTAYVYEAKGNIYLISMGYKQETRDVRMEDAFAQFVSNFKLK